MGPGSRSAEKSGSGQHPYHTMPSLPLLRDKMSAEKNMAAVEEQS